MSREPIPTWFFVLVIVRRDDRYLLVHERKHGQLWYLPAGRVEPGEDLAEAARRETLEESGIPVRLEGIVRVEHLPMGDAGSRVRVVYLARPVDDTPPKTTPDRHTLEARWVGIEDLAKLPLRGGEVFEMIRYVETGGAVHPLGLIAREGAPLGRGAAR